MRRFGLTTLSVLALLAAPAAGQQYRDLLKNDPMLEALTLPRIVSLGDLLKSPEAFRGITVRLSVTFYDLGKLENPFFTRFTTNNYMNLSAWDDHQAIWRKDEFLKSYPLLFVRRNTPVAEHFLDAKRFDRFAVEAVVQDTFRGKPWIEITDSRKEEVALSFGALRHLYHANSQADAGNYSLAQGELERALNAPMPNHHRVEALALSGAIEERLGNYAGAAEAWEEVLSIDPENKRALSEHARLELRAEQAAEAAENAEGTEETNGEPTPEMQETPEFLEPPKGEQNPTGGEKPAGGTPGSETGGQTGEQPKSDPVPAPNNGGETPPANNGNANGNGGGSPSRG